MKKANNSMMIKTLMMTLALSTCTISAFSGEPEKGDVGNGGMTIVPARAMIASPITTVVTPKENIEVTFSTNIGMVYATIRNNTGLKVMRAKSDTSLETNMRMNISNLPVGIYTFTLTDKQGCILTTQKITVD